MKYLIAILTALLLTACASTPLEGLHTEIDPDTWEIGFQRDFGAGNGYIREFVPKGESINNWSKLLSIEFFESEERPLQEFIHDFHMQRKAQCPGTEFTVLGEEEFTVTYLFSFPSCMGHEEQSEITRIYSGNDGLHRLSCSEKSPELAQDTIDQWLSEFDNSYLVKGPDREPVR